MSRKHAHRADNRPVTRRYVRRVQRARDDILRAIVNASLLADPDLDLSRFDRTRIYGDSPLVSIERIERAVNGTKEN